MKRWLLMASWLATAGCTYHPAVFADRPAVEAISDDRPIALPARSSFIEPVYLSEVYLRRPLVNLLDAERAGYARDVNALDEVPRSSWWDPPPLDPARFERAYAVEGPPIAPFTLLRKRSSRVMEVRDRRSRYWTLRTDPADFPGTRAPAGAIASRLVRAVGYRTLEVWLAGKNVSATRSPPVIGLGGTDMSGTRSGDPNDRIDHRDRRTLRALGVLAAWLDFRDIGPGRLIDVYVGAPGSGHVRHLVVGLDDALGAASLGHSTPTETAVGVVRGSAFTNLYTLGLTRPPEPEPIRDRTLRVLSPRVPRDFALSAPFDPLDRLHAADGYWMAKRIAAVPSELIERAVAAGRLSPGVARHVENALEARRQTLIARWMRAVTPLELVRLDGRALVLADEAIRLGHARDETTRYRISFLDDAGSELHELSARANAGQLALALPSNVLEAPYVVVRVVAFRDGKALPRAFEAHISTRGKPHVIGIRH